MRTTYICTYLTKFSVIFLSIYSLGSQICVHTKDENHEFDEISALILSKIAGLFENRLS